MTHPITVIAFDVGFVQFLSFGLLFILFPPPFLVVRIWYFSWWVALFSKLPILSLFWIFNNHRHHIQHVRVCEFIIRVCLRVCISLCISVFTFTLKNFTLSPRRLNFCPSILIYFTFTFDITCFPLLFFLFSYVITQYPESLDLIKRYLIKIRIILYDSYLNISFFR